MHSAQSDINLVPLLVMRYEHSVLSLYFGLHADQKKDD